MHLNKLLLIRQNLEFELGTEDDCILNKSTCQDRIFKF